MSVLYGPEENQVINDDVSTEIDVSEIPSDAPSTPLSYAESEFSSIIDSELAWNTEFNKHIGEIDEYKYVEELERGSKKVQLNDEVTKFEYVVSDKETNSTIGSEMIHEQSDSAYSFNNSLKDIFDATNNIINNLENNDNNIEILKAIDSFLGSKQKETGKEIENLDSEGPKTSLTERTSAISNNQVEQAYNLNRSSETNSTIVSEEPKRRDSLQDSLNRFSAHKIDQGHEKSHAVKTKHYKIEDVAEDVAINNFRKDNKPEPKKIIVTETNMSSTNIIIKGMKDGAYVVRPYKEVLGELLRKPEIPPRSASLRENRNLKQ